MYMKRKTRRKPFDVAETFILADEDQEGFEIREIDEHIGRKVFLFLAGGRG